MMLTIFAILVACFFAINIGASGTAAAMGGAYGGGATTRKKAVLFVAVMAFLGAVLGGGEVVKTLGSGIIPSELLNVELTLIILLAACTTLTVANLMAIPLSTSEVTVGSIVGVGLAYQQIYLGKLLLITATWLIIPFMAFLIASRLNRFLPKMEDWLYQHLPAARTRRVLAWLLVCCGCYEAFSAGMNNVANAIGPLVGAGLIHSTSAILLGGSCLSIGAIWLGGRVLETNGKKITQLSLMQGSLVSFTSGTLVIISSWFGLPVPLTQATTMAIFGIAAGNERKGIWKKDVTRRIIRIWVYSPLISLSLSFSATLLWRWQHPLSYLILFIILLSGAYLQVLRVRQKWRARKKASMELNMTKS